MSELRVRHLPAAESSRARLWTQVSLTAKSFYALLGWTAFHRRVQVLVSTVTLHSNNKEKIVTV